MPLVNKPGAVPRPIPLTTLVTAGKVPRTERQARQGAATSILDECVPQGMQAVRHLWAPRRQQLLQVLMGIDSRQLWDLRLDNHKLGKLLWISDAFYVCPPASIERAQQVAIDIEQRKLRIKANTQGLMVVGEYRNDGDVQPWVEPLANLNEHCVVLGSTNTGKSAYIAGMAAQHLGGGGKCVLTDAHGDLALKLIPYLGPEQRKRAVVIQVGGGDATWGINLLQAPRLLRAGRSLRADDGGDSLLDVIAEMGVDFLSGLEDDKTGFTVGARAHSQLRNILGLVATRENATFLDAFLASQNPKIRSIALEECSSPLVRGYISDFYAKFRPDFVDPARNKLEVLTRYPSLDLFSRRNSCMSLAEMMRRYDLIIFNFDQRQLPRNVVNNLGSLLLRHLLMTLDWAPMPLNGPRLGVFVDEFGSYASSAAINFLAEARKRGAFVVLGFQHFDQLSIEVKASLANAATWTVFRCGARDAEEVAKRFGLVDNVGRPDTAAFTDLPQYHAWHLTKASVRPGEPTRPVHVPLRMFPPALPRGDVTAELARMTKTSMAAVGKPFDPTDSRSVFEEAGATETDVLVTIHALQCAGTPATMAQVEAASLAIGRPVIDLARSGVLLTMERRAMIARVLDKYSLTAAGLAALRDTIDPGVDRSEGGPKHRQGVFDLYCALQREGVARIEVPAQQGSEPRPDLLLPAQSLTAASWARSLTAEGEVWLQFESATIARRTRIVSNINNALQAGARPVLVVRLPEDTAQGASFLDRLARDVEAIATGQMLVAGPVSVWGLTGDGRLGRCNNGTLMPALES